jgi:hypothetical protein
MKILIPVFLFLLSFDAYSACNFEDVDGKCTLSAVRSCNASGTGFVSYNTNVTTGVFPFGGKNYKINSYYSTGGKYYNYYGCEIINNGPSPQETCLSNGQYWYNNTCNSSPEPSLIEQCKAAGNYFYLGNCVTKFTPCDSIKNTNVNVRKAGVFSHLTEPPNSFCLSKSTVNTDPYDGCRVQQNGSIMTLGSGTWNTTFTHTGSPCNQTGSTASDDYREPDYETIFSNLNDQVCNVSEVLVDSTLPFGQMPVKAFSDEACTMSISTIVGTNPINGCTRYSYLGSSLAPPISSVTVTDLLNSANYCNYSKVLSCTVDQVPSEDGSSCESKYPEVSSDIVANISDGNPYSTFSVKDEVSYSFKMGPYSQILDFGSVNYSVPNTKSRYLPNILESVLSRYTFPNLSNSFITETQTSGALTTVSCSYSKGYSANSTLITLHIKSTCKYRYYYSSGSYHGSNIKIKYHNFVTLNLESKGFDYGGNPDTGETSTPTTTCDPSTEVCDSTSYLSSIASEAQQLRTAMYGDDPNTEELTASLNATVLGSYDQFIADTKKELEDTEASFSEGSEELSTSLDDTFTLIPDRINAMFESASCESLVLDLGANRTMTYTCDDSKLIRDVLAWVFAFLLLADIYWVINTRVNS